MLRSSKVIMEALALGWMACSVLSLSLHGAEAAQRRIEPRKVVVGTLMYNMFHEYPGLERRLEELGAFIDQMAEQAQVRYPGSRLDIAALPEMAVNGNAKGSAAEVSVPLEGPVLDSMGAKARQHQCYIAVPLYLVDDRPTDAYSNAVVLLDRRGDVVGTYRKVFPVAARAEQVLEGGVTPGREFPVFDCDFGRVGFQICFDICFDEGWETLRQKGAELVIWPTQSPGQIRPAFRAMQNDYYVLTSTWRNNASLLDPTGHRIREITGPDGIFVEQIDLDYVVLPWQPKLRDGKALSEKYGERVAYRYSRAEDCGIFWSNDTDKPILEMVRELDLELTDELLERNRRLYATFRGGPLKPASAASHAIASETAYYTTGPQQGRPPDGKLQAGTQVRILADAGSYLFVRTAGGFEVYVAADAVRPAGEPAADLSAIVEGGNQFALQLYRQLGSRDGNLFFSPSSISIALAMTYAGAAGETAAEMAQTLHFPSPKEQLHDGMHALLASWTMPSEKQGIRLNMANRLWGQERFEFLPQFLGMTREKYGAELARLNFAQSGQARQTINSWVADQTEDKITDLIPSGVLSSDTRLVLTNAVYFHGMWAEPFKQEQTQDEDFHLTAADTIKVPLMHRADAYQYAAADDLQLLELPYGNGALSMVVLLPRERDGLAGLEAQLTFENLQRWTAALNREDEVKVYLPKFKTTSQFELNRTLREMGLASAFDPNAADFSGMTGARDLFVSAVIHKAFVDVNEEGTEAAAATGVAVELTAAPIAPPKEPPVFRADHPFVFLIRDRRHDAILFMGRITNPLE